MKTKYDFCIIAGGTNERMGINYPKTLIHIDDELVLMRIVRQIRPYANNIFVCGSNKYKDHFLEAEKKLTDVTFFHFSSIDNSQDYPNGNIETVYQLLHTATLTEKIFLVWCDIYMTSHLIIEEMLDNYEEDCDFLIPTIHKKDPFGYLLLDEDEKAVGIEYRKYKPTHAGHSDQNIFLCDTQKIKDAIQPTMKKKEYNFLKIIGYLENVKYYETKYPVKSFNFVQDVMKISNNTCVYDPALDKKKCKCKKRVVGGNNPNRDITPFNAESKFAFSLTNHRELGDLNVKKCKKILEKLIKAIDKL